MATQLKELRDTLEILPIGAVRNRAVQNFGIKLSRDHTKEDIINLIIGVASKADFAQPANGDLPLPGWSRIKVHPVPGKPTFPFFTSVNGYFCWIPFNVEVDVPNKITNVLNDAIEMRMTFDDFGNKKESLEASYPYSLIHRSEGPDPRPGFEVVRERKLKAKREFAEKEGYWPKDADLKELRHARMLRDAIHDKD
jgi:hypothetical protein